MRKNQEELAKTGDFENRAHIVLHAREHEPPAVHFDILRSIDQNSEVAARSFKIASI
jgi:hypothetical protein